MPYRDRILERLEEVASYQRFFHEKTEEGHFHQISLTLLDLENRIREQIQRQTLREIQEVIRKLERDDSLEDEDMGLIRLWMISDAEFYVQLEADQLDWLKELNRIVDAIGEERSRELDLETMGRVSGLARDAIRVIADVVYFKRQESRIQNFEHASKRLYSEDKVVLARILKQKLRSGRA